ncbi:hypothetical protein LRB11_13425 [Ectothiorhodospira haloalkaliphila]|nr:MULTISPECIES: hypothetical protein [Ectothiorhodospira]MCG5498514.1 hypothetical protein [Ectothiorhodospira variabilis]MCG5525921.1 hypothetical protein [Ectothiorhodospira haloalkaliphila]
MSEYAGQATLDEIAQVRQGREAFFNRDPDSAVLERYISLEDTQLTAQLRQFTFGEMPYGRLTVFVQSDEGALVYLQRMPRGTGRGKRKLQDADDSHVEYLLPEPTDDDNDCGERDRLNYRVPLYPEPEFELTDEGDALRGLPSSDYKMVIKVLVFKRRNSSSHEVIKRAAARLGLSRHNLLRYLPESSGFVDVGFNRIEPGAKTLLLLHGTFSSTAGTFGDLYEKADFLSSLMAAGHFEQILALDHDTIFVSPEENVSRFDEILCDQQLQKPVRAIGFSRGALVLKQMTMSSHTVNIEHGVTVAGANHVGYFSALRGLKWLLTAMRHLSPPGPTRTFLSTLAQHSDKALDRLEGLRAMDGGSEINQRILQYEDPNSSTTLIPITGAFHPELVTPGWRRITRRSLNAAICVLLATRQHDWVVAVQEQGRAEPLRPMRPPDGLDQPIRGLHTRMVGDQLDNAYLKKALLSEPCSCG